MDIAFLLHCNARHQFMCCRMRVKARFGSSGSPLGIDRICRPVLRIVGRDSIARLGSVAVESTPRDAACARVRATAAFPSASNPATNGLLH